MNTPLAAAPTATIQKQAEPDYASARLNMIDGQLRPNGIRDERILTAMETLPREYFVPPQLAGVGAIDEELTVTAGRGLLRPLVLARLIQGAGVMPTDHVLDIGAMTAYSSAVLGRLAKDVVALESDPVLKEVGKSNIATLGMNNIEMVAGSLAKGWADAAPYNAIIINGGVEFIPEALFTQLAEGGRLMAVFRHYGPAHAAHIGELRLYEKIRGNISHRVLADATARLLLEFTKPQSFTF